MEKKLCDENSLECLKNTNVDVDKEKQLYKNMIYVADSWGMQKYTEKLGQ